jgi:predicted metal-binding membrane protein
MSSPSRPAVSDARPAGAFAAPAGRAAGTAWILAATALAWLLVVQQAQGMQASPGTMGLGSAAFLGLWVVMMAAMMLPSVAPLGAMLAGDAPGRSGRLTGLVCGYLAAWSGFGVVTLALSATSSRLADSGDGLAVWVGAAVLVAAGLYQFTPPKEMCLSACRSPLRIVLHVRAYRGPLRHVRAGIHHGLYCVGCCWALMVALLALGLMDLRWMVAFAVGVTLEKVWRHGERLSYAIGIGLIVLGLLAPWHPGIVPGLHRAATAMGMGMGM